MKKFFSIVLKILGWIFIFTAVIGGISVISHNSFNIYILIAFAIYFLLAWLSFWGAKCLKRGFKEKDANTAGKSKNILKKTLKIIGWIFLALFIVGIIGSAIARSYYGSSFMGQIERINRHCPIPVAGRMGEITSITLENKFITFHINYPNQYVNINAFKEYPGATRDFCFLSFVMIRAQGREADKLMDELISKGVGIRVVFSNDAKNTFTTELTPQFIARKRHEVELNPSEALHDALQLKLAMENINLPIQADDGMILTSISLEGQNLVLSLQISEDIYDMDVLQKAPEAFALGVLQAAKEDPENTVFLDLCKVSHTGLTYRMTGAQSKRQIDLNIPAEMIRRYHSTPTILNIH